MHPVLFQTLRSTNNIINVPMINPVVGDDPKCSPLSSYVGCPSDDVNSTFTHFLHPLPEGKTTVNGGVGAGLGVKTFPEFKM